MDRRSKAQTYPLKRIYFYLTDACNLRCRHCWIAPYNKPQSDKSHFLNLDLFKSIVNQAKPLGLAGVKLTGGEPLLHPRIHEILEVIRAGNLTVTMETNGVLVTPELAAALASCRNPFVSVSLDGADAESHEWVRGVPGCFEAALEGIRTLCRAGFRPQVIMTIMGRNKDQIEELVRLAESVGAGSVKFNLVQPTSRGMQMHAELETADVQELIELGKWVEGPLSAATNLRLYYSYPVAFRALGKLFQGNGCSCGICGILAILGVVADGSYALCGIGENVPELVFGHAADTSLEKVWNNAPVLEELHDGLPGRLEGICSKCLMKGLCLGACIAQNYYLTKNLWAPFWFCEEAQKRGLFPPSRMNREKHSSFRTGNAITPVSPEKTGERTQESTSEI